MARSGRARLGLALPRDVLSLAYGDLTERLKGERGPAFQEVTEAPAVLRRVVYRDRRTGRWASATSWQRSRSRLAGTGRAGNFTRQVVEVPTTGERLGEEQAGKALARTLRELGTGALRLTIHGQFSKEEGGALRPWTTSTITAAGLDPEGLAAILNAATRTWQKTVKSPPIILIERIVIERTTERGPVAPPKPKKRKRAKR